MLKNGVIFPTWWNTQNCNISGIAIMGEFVMRKSYDLFHVPKVSKYPNWEQKLGDAKKFVTVLYQGLSVIEGPWKSTYLLLSLNHCLLHNREPKTLEGILFFVQFTLFLFTCYNCITSIWNSTLWVSFIDNTLSLFWPNFSVFGTCSYYTYIKKSPSLTVLWLWAKKDKGGRPFDVEIVMCKFRLLLLKLPS